MYGNWTCSEGKIIENVSDVQYFRVILDLKLT